MYSLPDIFYDVNLLSTAIRLFLAVLFGGIIGLERGVNRHPAGFRTHILVFTALAPLPKVEDYFYRHASTVYLYIEIDSIDHFREFIKYIHTLNAKFYETQIIPGGGSIPNSVGFQLYLDLGKAKNLQEIENSIQNFDGVYLVEEL